MLLDLTCFCCLSQSQPGPLLPLPLGTATAGSSPTLAGPDGPPALCPLGQMEGKGDWIPLPTHINPGAKRFSLGGEVEVSGAHMSRLPKGGEYLL